MNNEQATELISSLHPDLKEQVDLYLETYEVSVEDVSEVVDALEIYATLNQELEKNKYYKATDFIHFDSLVEALDEFDAVFGYWVLHEPNYNNDPAVFEDQYHGEYVSFADFAREIVEESYSIPSIIEDYIDWDSYAQDLEYSGEFYTFEVKEGYYKGIHVLSTY